MVTKHWWCAAGAALVVGICTSTARGQGLQPNGPPANAMQVTSQGLDLQDSVGAGGLNEPTDVFKVSMRLSTLGFFDMATSRSSEKLVRQLRLFESVVRGRRRVSGSGKVDPGQFINRWLEASNAPRWMVMPGGGPGFISFERNSGDNHGYGTSWAADAIRGAGARYESYLRAHPGAAMMAINDTSLRWGGDTPDHAGHETGLDIDVRVPRTDGENGTTIRAGNYDRAAARAMIQAFLAQPGVSRILFNDPVLIGAGLCQASSGHDNHFHVDVSPPTISGSPSASSGSPAGGNGSFPALGGSSLATGSTSGSATALTPSSGQGSGVQAGSGELEILARIVKGEALICSPEGKIAVAAVVLNRVKSSKFPNTIKDVAHQPKQFSCYNPRYRKRLYEGPVPRTCYQAAQAALGGQDPTGGADHYFNPYIVKPSWAKDMKFLKRIGTNSTNTHEFYLSNGQTRDIAGNASKPEGMGGTIPDANGNNTGNVFSKGESTGAYNPFGQLLTGALSGGSGSSGSNQDQVGIGSQTLATQSAPVTQNTPAPNFPNLNLSTAFAPATVAPAAQAAPAQASTAQTGAANSPKDPFDPGQILSSVLRGIRGNALGKSPSASRGVNGTQPVSSGSSMGGLDGSASSSGSFAGAGADKLGGLQAGFREKVERILKKLESKGWQPRVVEGLRTRAQQAEKVRLGYSKTMNSRHLYGRAADIVDKRYGWGGPAKSHTFKFWKDLGAAAAAEGLTWGGNWRSFPDVAHVQQ